MRTNEWEWAYERINDIRDYRERDRDRERDYQSNREGRLAIGK